MSTIQQDAAGFQYGQVIELLQIDLTPFGGTVYRIYNSRGVDNAGVITFLGVEWNPIPYVSEGWGQDGTGSTPRPTITIADYDGILLASALDYQDLIGAKVYKWETTAEHLEDGTCYGPEIWLVNEKLEADGLKIKIQLASPMDQKSIKLPSWQMFRDEFPALGTNRV